MNITQYREMKAKETAQKTEQPTTPEQKTENNTTEVVENKPKQSEEKEKPSDFVLPEKITIDGIGEISVDELKNGYLRQSDYTKKTQDLSKQRTETKEAIAFFDYLKANPEVAKQVVEITKNKTPQSVDPNQSEIVALKNTIYDLKLEMEISKLQGKYSDFEVREVLEMARDKGLTNLEDAYKLVKSTKPVQTEQIDKETLKAQLREEVLKEIENENKSTKTIISTTNSANPIVTDNTPKISDAEKLVAKKMRLSESDYIKWRDASKKKK
ncbi:hypothetical protein A7K50_03215 [Dehalobacter sp. MCB1]|uniref:hypothetical protein n=1 Tax=Dehalobacter sp. MCB1 TaxID=1844756 RepID=UPI000E6B957D|nr:hypothetical protein [Dehalobacter sp. MCB1]RJE47671.1 hypothetical protein A7K50_03215 [Dehalobacter sp. MCB1]